LGVSLAEPGTDVLSVGSEQGQQQSAPIGETVNQPNSPTFKGLGALLEEEDPKKVVDTIVQMICDQAGTRKRQRAEWECAKLWINGIRGARVRRESEDRNDVELVVPLGAFDLPPVMDRCDELLEKTVAHLLSDPPVPDAEPASDSDTDRDAAEFTTRLLTVEGSESGFNNLSLMRRAARKAGVYDSAFIYGCIDPTGGGWRPTEIRALQTATNTQDATIDPETGQPVTDADDRLTTRYVRADNSLTDSPAEARPQWLPKLVPEVLTGNNVILLPENCSGIADALGCIIIRWTPLSKLKAQFADVLGQANDETLRKIIDWRPEDSKFAKPGFTKDKTSNATTEGQINDQSLCCTLCLYYTSHSAYLKGAYLCVAGEDMVLHKQPWSGMVETIPGVVTEECLMLPVAQERHLDDDVDDNPMGRGLIRKIGPADDVRGQIVLGWLDYLDRFNNPIPMLPLGSIVQPGALERNGNAIYFNPQGKPEWETIPGFPADAKEFFDRATDAQNSAVGLEETAQGAESPNAVSGIAKQIVVQQAHVNLATLRANLADCQERWWRICAQLFRVFYTIPQKLKYQGDDGAYKEREWTRIDLGSTRDIRIARGSFTQQSHEQKQANLDARFAAKLIDAEEYDRLTANNIQAVVGFQDNPHRMRVRRQISAWKEGPPADFQQKEQQYAVLYQQWQQATLLAQQTGQPAPPPPEDPATPFDSRPVDREQDVARIRWLELRREQAGSAFAKQDKPWQAKFLAAYETARKDAGILTIAEQQQAAQAQATAQAAQQQQSDTIKAKTALQGKAMDHAHDANQSAESRQFESDQENQRSTLERERMAMDAQGGAVPKSQAPPVRSLQLS
jgi:hypothetical protein